MLIFLICAALALVGLARVIYFVDGWAEQLATGLGAPASYGAAVANLVLLMLVIVMTTGALLTVAERKWSAMMQNRIGPNRIRVFGNALGGVPFLIADALKMLTKENI